VLEKNMIRLVVILLAATNAERSIAVAHRVADAERAAVPCAVQGANCVERLARRAWFIFSGRES
jgi:hypothetical protein